MSTTQRETDGEPGRPGRTIRAAFGESPLHALLWLLRIRAAPPQASAALVPSRLHRARLREWLHRYGLAECGGVAGAVLATYVARHLTHNAIAAAYAGAWGETLGYTATIVTRDFLGEHRAARVTHQRLRFGDAARVITGLAAEFGPAGALDSFVTRPLAMALGTRVLGAPLGVVAGKVAADLVFYVPVVLIYERRKRRRARS